MNLWHFLQTRAVRRIFAALGCSCAQTESTPTDTHMNRWRCTSMNELTRSKSWRVLHEYEVAFLMRPDGKQIAVGHFYGDPVCAVISPDETWCAIAGEGLIVYFLREPFEAYRYDHPTRQWIEFGRTQDDLWYIEALTALSESEIAFTADPYGDRPGRYIFNVTTGNVKKE